MKTFWPGPWVVAALVASCSGTGSSNGGGSPRCVPGDLKPCPCAGGGQGIQQCLADGTWSACDCSAGSSGGNSSSGGPASSSAVSGSSGGGASGSSNASGGLSSGVPGSSSSSSGGSSPGVPGAPLIQSVTLGTASLRVGYATSVVVLASDPDGVGDIASGAIRDVDSGLVVSTLTPPVGGAGTTAFLEGRINTEDLSPITFPTGGGTRNMRVVVADQAGHEARLDFLLPLDCGPVDRAACSDVCVNLSSDVSNCGACGRTIPTSLSSQGWTRCFQGGAYRRFMDYSRTSCADVCAAQGAVCMDGLTTAAVYRTDGTNGTCDHPNGAAGFNMELDCASVPPQSVTCPTGPGSYGATLCDCVKTW